MKKKYDKNPFLEWEPFHVMTGNTAVFDVFSDEELEYLLEAMVEWEHYPSCTKIKREIDRRKR